MTIETSKSEAIYALRVPDEIQFPYGDALAPLCSELKWFDSFDELLKAGESTKPLAVIVDLDALPRPVEPLMEQLRRQYGDSALIAQSSEDSSRLALQSLRSGFSDFLLKPISPEELSWSVRRLKQRYDLLVRFEDPKADMVRTVGQIASCASPTLARLYALEYLKRLFHSEGAAWLTPTGELNGAPFKVESTVPKEIASEDVLAKLPEGPLNSKEGKPRIMRNRQNNSSKVLMFCKDPLLGMILLWGVKDWVESSTCMDASLVIQHSELSLMNLSKLAKIRQQTFTDELTGLYNNRYLRFALQKAIQHCRKPEEAFSVLFIDVDHFKQVNDRNGHLVGSKFLVTIGKTIKNAVRQFDSVFRYGGDEFVVILKGAPLTKAREIAERIRRHVERRVFVIDKKRIQTTVSIGLAAYPTHTRDVDALMKLADDAMYAVKKSSRNAVHIAMAPQGPENTAEKPASTEPQATS